MARLCSPGHGEDRQPGPGDPGIGEGQAGQAVAARGVLVAGHQLAGIGVEGRRFREQRRGMAVGPQAEVDDVELADLAEPQLVGVGALVAAHRVHGVGGPDPLQQGLAPQALVGVGVVGGTQRSSPQYTLTDSQSITSALVGGQPLVTGPGRCCPRPGPGRTGRPGAARRPR